MNILTEATLPKLWQEALQAAQTNCHISLKTDVESYLVMMLIRHTRNTQLAREAMAIKFLQALNYPFQQRELKLQNVGDQCLLITGLFPTIAEKKLVKLRYYIELGQYAYGFISRKNNDIFSLLAQQFVLLMDVLQSFRPYTFKGLPKELLPYYPTNKK